MALLDLKDVSKNFGKLQAVSDLDFDVNKGEIHSLIGPNGAGKTTVFNLITGTYPLTSGKIVFNGDDITGLQSHQTAQKGIGRSFQGTFLFMQQSVLDNLMIGFHMTCRAGVLNEFLHTRSAKKVDEECRQKALEIIEFMGLGTLKSELAGNLPHGHQRALGVSIALACAPTLLMLDEPVTGMNPTETVEMVERIRRIRDRGITIILVEQNARMALKLANTAYVLEVGTIALHGDAKTVANDANVIKAYLGG